LAIRINWSDNLLQDLRRITEDPPGTEEFLDEEGKWQCTGCGACCEDVRWCLPDWMVHGTTRCKHLTEDKQCAIYEDRPWVCRMSTFQDVVDKNPRKVARGCAHMRNWQYGRPGTSEDSE
jgi:Fe-S-cluster containining protein